MMKSYKKMADEVLEAVSEYNTKRIKRQIRLRIAAPAACCCLAAVLALGMWKSGIFNSIETAKPDTDFNWTGKSANEPSIGEETETDSDTASDTAEEQPQITSDSEGTAFDPSESGAVSEQDTPTEATTEAVQHPPLETAEFFTERVPVANEPNSYFEFVENVHAPLDGYDFTLPLTTKDTDIILALLNAYDIPDGSSDAVNTQYALDIGIYLEAGYSNVRTYINAEKGDNVYALQDGTVIYADYNGSLGNNVWVKNSEGTYILYYHLNEMAVNYGDTVSKDQIIGYAGSTGRTTGNTVGYSRRNTVTDSMWADWYNENGKIVVSPFADDPPVWIPVMEINHGGLSEGSAIDTEDFIIYMDMIYFKYGEADAAALDSYMGTTSGTIDEYERSNGIGYANFSGTAAVGDVYGVKNCNTSDFLGIKRGNKADIYFHNNGIALRCGSDLICHMLKMYDYSNKEYCYNGTTCWHCTSDSTTLNTDELIKFLDTVSEAEFEYFDDTSAGALIEKIQFTMENGIKYEFELYEGGFVRFDGLKSVCLNVGAGCFEAGHNEHDEYVEHTEYSEHHSDHHSGHH